MRLAASSGFSISSRRSNPTFASQSLNGSALGDGMDEAEELFGVGDIGQALPAIGSGHFQSVTFCNGLVAIISQTLFQHPPINLGIVAFRQDCNDVHDGEIPFLFVAVPCAADLLFFKENDGAHGACIFSRRKQWCPMRSTFASVLFAGVELAAALDAGFRKLRGDARERSPALFANRWRYRSGIGWRDWRISCWLGRAGGFPPPQISRLGRSERSLRRNFE